MAGSSGMNCGPTYTRKMSRRSESAARELAPATGLAMASQGPRQFGPRNIPWLKCNCVAWKWRPSADTHQADVLLALRHATYFSESNQKFQQPVRRYAHALVVERH